MSAHTPGPWTATDTNPISGTTDAFYIFVEPGVAVIEKKVEGQDQNDWPNARLIAAAPELLEAAKIALFEAESWIHDQLDGTSSLNGALAKLDSVRAAIRKAEGR